MVPYCYLFLLSVFILWFTYYVSNILRYLNDHLSWKKLFIRFTAHAFRKLLSIYVFSYFPFGFEGRIWDLIYQFLVIAYLFMPVLKNPGIPFVI